jgi:hypothetical protein
MAGAVSESCATIKGSISDWVLARIAAKYRGFHRGCNGIRKILEKSY